MVHVTVRHQAEFQSEMRINASRSVFRTPRDVRQRSRKAELVGAKRRTRKRTLRDRTVDYGVGLAARSHQLFHVLHNPYNLDRGLLPCLVELPECQTQRVDSRKESARRRLADNGNRGGLRAVFFGKVSTREQRNMQRLKIAGRR